MTADPRYTLDFALSRLIRYNGKRQRFFDRLHGLTSFVNAAAGTSAFVAVLSRWPALAASLTGVIALVSAADSTVGFSERARKHGELRSRYFNLYCELVRIPPEKFNEDKFREKRLRIESDGPPPMRVLDVICRNEECTARGFPDTEIVRISWFRSLICQFVDWPPRRWKKLGERNHG